MFSGLRAFFGRIRAIFVRKEAAPPPPQLSVKPYTDVSANLEYNCLFCDNRDLFRPLGKQLDGAWRTIFSREPTVDALKTIAEDVKVHTRTRLLAYNLLRSQGVINNKEVLGAVIEVGSPEGTDTLAVYKDLSARYVTAAGKTIARDAETGSGAGINEKVQTVLAISQKVIGKATAWQQARPAPPAANEFRITFLSADGMYPGSGKLDTIRNDAVASAIIGEAGQIMTALNKWAREHIIAEPAPAPATEPEKLAAATPAKAKAQDKHAGKPNNANTPPAPVPDNNLKIMVLKNGEIRIANKIVTLREVEAKISQLTQSKGALWFYREPGRDTPPQQATEVIKIAVRYKVPVSVSSKPDFSDELDDKGNYIPRK
jgi:hypothetical protein